MGVIIMTLLGGVLGAVAASAIAWCVMQEEVDRLKRGDFTSDELQSLCHNLDGNDYLDFCDGCTDCQRKLFNGRSREDELTEGIRQQQTEIKDLVRIVRDLRAELKSTDDKCDDVENQRLRAWLLYIQNDNKNAVTNGFAVANQIDAALDGRPTPKINEMWPDVVRGYGRTYS